MSALLKRLKDAGLSVRIVQGRIAVGPAAKLTPELRQLIRDKTFELIRDLTPVSEWSDYHKATLGLIGRPDERPTRKPLPSRAITGRRRR